MTLLMLAILIPVLFSAIVVAINFLPLVSDFPVPSEFTDALILVFSYVKAWSGVFPAIDTLFVVFGLVIGVELGFMLWYGIRWTIGLVRGTKG